MRGAKVLSDPDLFSEPEVTSGATIAPPVDLPDPGAGPSFVSAPSPSDWYTSLNPDEAARRIVRLAQGQGWTVNVSAPGRLDLEFTIRHRKPNFAIGCLLSLLFIVPGIIYGILARLPRHLRVSLMLAPTEGGTRIVPSGTRNAVGRLSPIVGMLP